MTHRWHRRHHWLDHWRPPVLTSSQALPFPSPSLALLGSLPSASHRRHGAQPHRHLFACFCQRVGVSLTCRHWRCRDNVHELPCLLQLRQIPPNVLFYRHCPPLPVALPHRPLFRHPSALLWLPCLFCFRPCRQRALPRSRHHPQAVLL